MNTMKATCRHYSCRLLLARELREKYEATKETKYLLKAVTVHDSEVLCRALEPVTLHDIVLLSTAIDGWEHEKGAMMPEDWPPFEKRIANARKALEKVHLFIRGE